MATPGLAAQPVETHVAPLPRPPRRVLASIYSARWFRFGICLLSFVLVPLTFVPLVSRFGVEAIDTTFVLSALVAASFSVSGAVAWFRRPDGRTGPLLVGVGILQSLGMLLSLATPSLLFTLSNPVRTSMVVLLSYVLLSFPLGRLISPIDKVIFAVIAFVGVVLEFIRLLFFDEPRNTLSVWPNDRVADAINTTQRWLLAIAVAALMVRLVVRWIEASGPFRRALTPALVGGATLVVLAAILLVNRQTPDSLLWLVELGFTATPIALLASMLSTRLARAGVAHLVIELGANPPPAELRDALARALRDTSLELAFWLPEYDTYADVDGHPLRLPEDDERRAVTLIARSDEPNAALIHDASLRDDPELLDAVGAAAGIALENARLQAELRARLLELQASRARIVEATDSERRRLERNLHDGAQQRLVAISLELGRLEARAGADPEMKALVQRTKQEAEASLNELRELARGIHPALVTDHGLAVALEALVARAPIPLTLEVELDRRLPQPIEVAAYYVVSECVTNVAKYACASETTVGVRRNGRQVVIEIRDDGIGGADTDGGSGLRGLADRVEALGGRLRVWSPAGGGTRVQAEIPCA